VSLYSQDLAFKQECVDDYPKWRSEGIRACDPSIRAGPLSFTVICVEGARDAKRE
jgi:hypothetical protein